MPRRGCPNAGTVLQTGMAVDAMPPRKLTLGQQLRGYPVYSPTWTQRGFASESGPNPSAPSSSSSQSTSSASNISIYTQKGKKAASKALHKSAETLRWLARRFAVLCAAFARNPLIVVEWYEDIRDAINHFLKWVYTGFKLFGADVRTSFYLTKRVIKGYPLSVKERRLLVRTTSDCLKLIPFSFFLVVPFAELALPFFLRLFPNMLPSTFFEQKYDNATLARKLKAKQEMADFWQQVVAQRTQELYESDEYADKAEELQAFQEKLSEGKEFPTLKEILRFASVFKSEMHLENMSTQQLHALSQMLGLPTSRTFWQGHVEVQLRHHITNLRREDRDLFWEGIDGLKAQELIDVCRRRAIRFHGVTEDEMRESLNRWLRLSATHRQIPTSMLLWIQSFYLRDTTDPEADSTEDLKLKMQEKEIIEKPEDAFLSWAERQKDAVEKMQQKLEELQREIIEVMDQHQDKLQEQEKSSLQDAQPMPALTDAAALTEACSNCGHFPLLPDSVYCRKCGHRRNQDEYDDDPQGDKRRMLHILRKVEEDLNLYRQVVQKQRGLLDHQLRFLLAMRDTTPTNYKDADVILLDQRVRLLEMINSFQENAEEIDNLFNVPAVSEENEAPFSSSLWADSPGGETPGGQGMPNDSVDRIDTSLPGLPGSSEKRERPL
eukprot:CAMPEP_0181401582 /NCGR_PEP_ID=MMETSP1110-20121109/2722_1 /TAXON_ID=174948 /ORGANISM="Symbiodinium sp., Strain CCMP421" /LENGTH=663 /DNA_ID=CAMNT_0023523751 /DNA_START=90 /DNA_END=2081 /DNA_ORIENTATION=+